METSETEKGGEQRPSKRKAIEAWIARERPERITPIHWRTLIAQHGPISESYLRTLLRDSGVPLDPLVDGVRQDSFDALEHSLVALACAYEAARASSNREAAAACRKAVISGKDHARWAAERAKDSQKKADKEEMTQWMIVWLENPPLFREWVRVRRAAMEKASATEAPPTPPE